MDTHYVYDMNCLQEIPFFGAKRRTGTWAVRVIWTIPLVFFKWSHECNAFRSTPWSRVHSEKLTCFQLVKKFPAFYVIRRFITAFTSAHYLSLTWARAIQSVPPHATSWRSILLLPSHLRLGLPSGLLLSGPPTKILYTSLLSPTMPHIPPISFLFMLYAESYLIWSAEHKVPSYVVFATHLLSGPT